ncbi:FAD-binding domain-containing protein [Calothrix sp. NIES-3974]|uniref:FAD-binding domain-containing protein n=1 Tax=Calothrix sp. NIES-3974 TaxID=2005462 RepID=UPI000B60DFD6|nr:FAD-binding domain-containing protein [Calothrix sp. NIES-3974]BAZ06991.1 deoxyribodipyrimidine photo-lyase type I [Calothrix sp. NIES-3974]
MSDLILFWHRRDLRITDNTGLALARQRTPQVVGVFCLDPQILKGDDIAAVRVKYLIGCLQDLRDRYLQAGSQLLIVYGNPVVKIPELATGLGAKAVYWNWDVEPYAQKRDRAMLAALQEKGIETIGVNWDQLLHSPDEICTGAASPYTVYGPFWKNWSSKPKAKVVAAFRDGKGLSADQLEKVRDYGVIALPSSEDLGFSWDGELVIAPGEDAAQKRLEEFCQRAIYEYEPERNFPYTDGTSQLSAPLKFGVLGIRQVWEATETAMSASRSDEAQNSIRTYQQELAWREFYQHVMYHFPELADGPYRQPFKDFPWDNNEKYFQAWCAGETGYPIVDAAMRQLNTTGWMHNRCRMIVASFLTKDLMIDWRWGEKYFMQHLIDGDLSANNGGWQWSASSGMDPKPLRIFNPASQAQKFDPDGEYIRTWVEELRSLDTEYIVTGKITPLERRAVGYPQPIVDHQVQQKLFKERYQKQKQTD